MTNSLRPHHPEHTQSHLNTTNRRKKKLLSCFSHFQGLLWGISPLSVTFKAFCEASPPLLGLGKAKQALASGFPSVTEIRKSIVFVVVAAGATWEPAVGSSPLHQESWQWAFEPLIPLEDCPHLPSLQPVFLSIPSAPSLSKAFIHSCLCPCKSILTGELVPVSCLSHLVHTPQFSISYFGVTPLLTASQWPLLPALPHLPPTAVQKNIIKTLVNQGKRSPHTLPAHTCSVTHIWDLLPFLLNGEAQP